MDQRTLTDKRKKKPLKSLTASIMHKQAFDASKYEFDSGFRPWKPGDSVASIHTFPCLLNYLESSDGETAQLDAKYFIVHKGQAYLKQANKKEFLETIRNNKKRTFRESIDMFSYEGGDDYGPNVGQDFTPLIGGPFIKNLYIQDFLKMANAAFFAYHNDPIARQAIRMMRTFTLGRGYRVDCKDKQALALWEAFSLANDVPAMINQIALEAPIYGETMLYWLPVGESKITYRIPKDQIPRGLLPRVRVIDPTTIWEIVTYPEDITRVIYYQQIFPTQYQLYGSNEAPTSKFIYQQLPANDIMHFKLNSVTGEKRGRSDLFPVLGYLKRLRDGVNYSIIADMKNSAWCIDTTIKGDQNDVDSYVKSQQAMTIPPAGSEFVHSEAVQRDYRTNGATGANNSNTFEWAMSMIAAGLGIPVSYFGTHLHGGSTRASAVIGTEPVTKLMEDRQLFYENILLKLSGRLFDMFGINAKLEISFPEIITQDRSAKMKDVALAVSEQFISRKRGAEISAKELGITDFDFENELKQIELEKQHIGPMTAAPVPSFNDAPLSQSAITGTERKQITGNEYSA